MKNYQFYLTQNGSLVGEGFGSGHGAIEAFENAVTSGSVIIPKGQEVKVAATCESGLQIGFEAHQL